MTDSKTNSVPDILEKISARTRERLIADRARRPLAMLENEIRGRTAPQDFAAAFRDGGPHVIAEVKLASPSEGPIAPGADPVRVATAYQENGATAISVLTERDFFGGQPENLARIRAALPQARLLMKDFVIEEYQVARARADGADALLLIVALLAPARLAELLRATESLGLSALVEVHDERELEIALGVGASLIGVNNRDLRTMQVALATSERIASRFPIPGKTFVTESGLGSGADVSRLATLGFRGFLVGTHFMRQTDPGAALRAFLLESNSHA